VSGPGLCLTSLAPPRQGVPHPFAFCEKGWEAECSDGGTRCRESANCRIPSNTPPKRSLDGAPSKVRKNDRLGHPPRNTQLEIFSLPRLQPQEWRKRSPLLTNSWTVEEKLDASQGLRLPSSLTIGPGISAWSPQDSRILHQRSGVDTVQFLEPGPHVLCRAYAAVAQPFAVL
jgi:hypothetical protein